MRNPLQGKLSLESHTLTTRSSCHKKAHHAKTSYRLRMLLRVFEALSPKLRVAEINRLVRDEWRAKVVDVALRLTARKLPGPEKDSILNRRTSITK